MKKPTLFEVGAVVGSLRLGFIKCSPLEKRVLIAAGVRWAREIMRECKFTLSASPGMKQIYFFRTRAEGEKLRRWLIKNIDLNPKIKVVPL